MTTETFPRHGRHRHHHRRPWRRPPRIRYIRRPPRIIRRPYPYPFPVPYEIPVVVENDKNLKCEVVEKKEMENQPTEIILKCLEPFLSLNEHFEDTLSEFNTNVIFAVLWGLVFVGFVLTMILGNRERLGENGAMALVVLGFVVVNSLRVNDTIKMEQGMLSYSSLSAVFALIALISGIRYNTKAVDFVFMIIWTVLALWFGFAYLAFKKHWLERETEIVDETEIN